MSPERALAELLCDLFDVAQLRQFVEQSDLGEQLRAALPGPAGALRDVAHVVATEGRRRHLLTPAFFDALAREFPLHAARIQAVHTRFAAKPPAPTPAVKRPWRRIAAVIAVVGTIGALGYATVLHFTEETPPGGGLRTRREDRHDTSGSSAGAFSPRRVRDVVDLRNGKIFFFRNDAYARFDKRTNRIDRPYRAIREFWGAWPADFDAVDAAVRVDRNNDAGGTDPVAYMFRGDRYLIYDIALDAVSHPPQPIREGCEGWPEDWTSVDAALNLETGTDPIYIFRGGQVLGLHDRQADAPRPIGERFPGVFPDGVEAAFAPGDGKAYFLRGQEYLRYDIFTNTLDSPVPAPIAGKWPGLVF